MENMTNSSSLSDYVKKIVLYLTFLEDVELVGVSLYTKKWGLNPKTVA